MLALKNHGWPIMLLVIGSGMLLWCASHERPSVACCPPYGEAVSCCKSAPYAAAANLPPSGMKLPARSPLWQSIVNKQRDAAPDAKQERTLIATFADQSELAVQLSDESLELETRFGVLTIPLTEIHSIKFRDCDLESLKPNASENTESSPRRDDLVVTVDATVSGKIRNTQLTMQTRYFGVRPVALAQLRSLEWVDAQNEPTGPILTDPGMLTGCNQRIGETFWFRITGQQHGAVFGTDLYTTDASLASAAVHAGAVQVGETAVVKVTIVPSPPQFLASVRSGISSHAYGLYVAAFRVERTNLKP